MEKLTLIAHGSPLSHVSAGSSLDRRHRATLPLLLFAALFCTPTFGQGASSPATPQRSPRDWAVLASNNEILTIDHAGSALRYRVHTVDAKGDRLRDVIECAGGSVSRLLAINGKPLSAEQETEERKRLQDLAEDPAAFLRHSQEDAKSKKLARDLISLMPDAMIYTRVPSDDSHSADGTPALAFDFSPNPQWHAPSTISEALTGLRGRIWVDQRTGYVQHLHAEIFRPVNFGYGMVAHIFPGGHVEFAQVDVGKQRWIYSHFAQNLRIRALMLKTIDINTTIDTAEFQQVPAALTVQQAIALLLN